MNKSLLEFNKFRCRKEDRGEEFIHPDEFYSAKEFNRYRHVSISCDMNYHMYSQLTILLNNVKHWLEDEIGTNVEQAYYDEYKDDIGGVDSFDDGILEGRHECAKSLLNMIGQWENKMAFNKIPKYVDWQHQDPEGYDEDDTI